MSAVLDQVLSANTRYAADFGDKGSLALPPVAEAFALAHDTDSAVPQLVGLRSAGVAFATQRVPA